MERRFVIRSMRYPERQGDMVKWLCMSLGLSGNRDKNRIGVVLFRHLLENKSMSEEELARIAGVSRTTVAHHLMKMVMSGLATKKSGVYELSGNSLDEMLDDMKIDIISALERIKRIANEIDRSFMSRNSRS